MLTESVMRRDGQRRNFIDVAESSVMLVALLSRNPHNYEPKDAPSVRVQRHGNA